MDTTRVLRSMVIAVSLAMVTACAYPSGPETSGDCDLVVQVNAIVYAVDSDLMVPQDFTPGKAHATVAARKDCADLAVNGVEVGDRLEDRESTFLPAGTLLYPMAGFEVTERLAAKWDGEWVVVTKKATSAGDAGEAGDAVDAAVELRLGQEGQVSGTPLLLRFVAVVEDSRCPVDVSCVWEGNARVSLETVMDGDVESHILDSNEAAWPDGSTLVTEGEYEVSFVSLLPAPSSTTHTDPADYVLALRVRSRTP